MLIGEREETDLPTHVLAVVNMSRSNRDRQCNSIITPFYVFNRY